MEIHIEPAKRGPGNPYGNPNLSPPFKYPDENVLIEKINAFWTWLKAPENRIEKQVVTGKGEIVVVHVERPASMSELASYLGLSRPALMEYRHKSDKIANAIAQVRAGVEAAALSDALIGKTESRTASLNLCTNHGFTTRETVDRPLEPISVTIDFGLQSGQAEELHAARQEIQRLRAEVAHLRAVTDESGKGAVKSSDMIEYKQSNGNNINTIGNEAI